MSNAEDKLVGTLDEGTYIADWATLTAGDIREAIWEIYDQPYPTQETPDAR